MTRRLPFLLTLLLLAQVTLLPAHCLLRAAASNALTLTICTADGLRSLTLHGSDEAPAAPQHAEPCLACHALPAAAEAAPPAISAPAWIGITLAWPTTPGTAVHPPIRGPPSGARAPPAAI